MTELLKKATALLEARKKATKGQWAIPHANVFRVIAPDAQHKNPKEGICPPYPWAVIADTDPNSLVGEGHEAHANACFMAISANTSAEIITGYQELVRRMADTLEFYGSNWESDPPPPEGPEDYKDWINPAQKLCEDAGERAREILTEARAALPHTSTKS